MKKIFSTLIVLAIMGMVTAGTIDYVDIGCPISEMGHNIHGWSAIWTWGGTYGGGDDGTLRTVIPREPNCQDDDREAYFTMSTTGTAQTLTLMHLVGSQNDGYELYLQEGRSWTMLNQQARIIETCVGDECWYTDTFDLGSKSGTLNFKIISIIDPIPPWCTSWGINAFSWASLEGEDAHPAPEFGSLSIALAILLTTPAFAYLVVKKRG